MCYTIIKLAEGRKFMVESLPTKNRYRYFDENGSHLHTLDNRPLIGTSRVVSVIAKPLAWYGSGKAVEVFGCPDPKVLTKIRNKKATQEEIETLRNSVRDFLQYLDAIPFDEYLGLLDKAYRAHDTYKRKRAVSGTDVHAECETFINDEMRHGPLSYKAYPEQIHSFINWSRENVKRWLWSEGHCYSERHWLGGISDAGYEKRDGRLGILDFKSSREAYVSQFWQCAGYQIQICENGILDADGNMLLMPLDGISEYCIFAFGGVKPQPYFFFDPAGAQEAFLAALTIYKKLPQ